MVTVVVMWGGKKEKRYFKVLRGPVFGISRPPAEEVAGNGIITRWRGPDTAAVVAHILLCARFKNKSARALAYIKTFLGRGLKRWHVCNLKVAGSDLHVNDR